MNDESDPIMPFGKYKGERISEISTDYLDWVIGQIWLEKSICHAIKRNLEARSDWRAI